MAENDAIQKLKKIIANSGNIVFFGGAGVSTESGIPDFRSEKGLYKAMNEYGHPAEELISHTFYQHNPEIFFDYYKKNLVYTGAKPNAAHYALAKLEKQGKLSAIVTQNIDGLHQLAGSQTVYELHGSILRNYCSGCGEKYDLDYILDPANCSGSIPKCRRCGSVVRPDVVLYEESLDDATIDNAVHAISKADTLIIGGTSLVVYPAAGLIRYFRGSNLILINKSATAYDNRADLVINESIGQVFAKVVE